MISPQKILTRMHQQHVQAAQEIREHIQKKNYSVIEGINQNGDTTCYTAGLSWHGYPELISDLPQAEFVWAMKWIADSLICEDITLPDRPVLLRYPDLKRDLWLAPVQSRMAAPLARITQIIRSEEGLSGPLPMLGVCMTQPGERPRGWLFKMWSDRLPSSPREYQMPRPSNTPDSTLWTCQTTPPASELPAQLMMDEGDEDRRFLARQISDHTQRVMAQLRGNHGTDRTTSREEPPTIICQYGPLTLTVRMKEGRAILPAVLTLGETNFKGEPSELDLPTLRAAVQATYLVTGHWPVSQSAALLDQCDDAGVILDAPHGSYWSLMTGDTPVIKGPEGPWNPEIPWTLAPIHRTPDEENKP